MPPAESPWPRVVAHADMDAFYAAVEQFDDPALRGRPLLIGSPGNRGVVLTASHEAPHGVGSAMPMARRGPDDGKKGRLVRQKRRNVTALYLAVRSN